MLQFEAAYELPSRLSSSLPFTLFFLFLFLFFFFLSYSFFSCYFNSSFSTFSFICFSNSCSVTCNSTFRPKPTFFKSCSYSFRSSVTDSINSFMFDLCILELLWFNNYISDLNSLSQTSQ